MANVLIIDDDHMFCEILKKHVSYYGHDVVCAFNGNEGIRASQTVNFDVVYLDVNLSDCSGLDLIPQIRETTSRPEVIIITGSADTDGAKLAIRNGAWDYIEKQSTTDAMLLPLIRVLEYRKDREGEPATVLLNREGIVGSSKEMSACLENVAKAAISSMPVCIQGETGTGKEMIAKAIHANSVRKNKDMVTVDCASIPEYLAESILFGHKKGAFTGAGEDRTGLIAKADGGTLFLDEIGELARNIQKSFLRVLQTGVFRPVGENNERKSDFRLISATNRDLESMVGKKIFREDLFYRIRTYQLMLPPLRKRKSDIPELCIYYISRLCSNRQQFIKGFSPEFFSIMMDYNWPGNIRELINTLEASITNAAEEGTLHQKHIPEYIRVQLAEYKIRRNTTAGSEIKTSSDLSVGTMPSLQLTRDGAIARIEREYLVDLLKFTKRNIGEACQISGLSRSRLYALLKKYEIN